MLMAVVKISPGMRAKYWENNDCLENRHICVGWSKIGDLRKFSAEHELRAAVNEDLYHGRARGAASRTAWQLWTLRNLKAGDKVIANKGNSIVLRVGTVTGPYRWDAKHHYHHVVPVDWNPWRERQKIPRQKQWNNKTIADDISPALYKRITGEQLPKDAAVNNSQDSTSLRKELMLLDRLDEERRVLARKEQAFLRNHLFGGAAEGCCFLCGEKIPVELLVTAHIKPRAKCSDKERRDDANIVPMCILGCDALFERRHVAVVKNKLNTRLGNLVPGSRLRAILKALERRPISVQRRQQKYFEWHSKRPPW
jgi:hypothetical protein